MPRRCAFTLVELLTVIAVTGILLALLLPALARARESAVAAQCRSNIRQQGLAWENLMVERGGRMPYITNVSLSPNWMESLDEIVPAAPSLNDPGAKSAFACPAIGREYGDVTYTTQRWGYAINRWWSNNPPENNDLKNWYGVGAPSTYPIFVTPEVVDFFGSGYIAAASVPDSSTTFGPPNWGVGAHFSDGETVHTAFADGHVAAVQIDEIRAGIGGIDDYRWFTHNR